MSSNKVNPNADCIVVGGGIIGLLVARKLSQGGKTVILVEKGQVGQESSWAAGGILASLSPWGESEFIFKLLQKSQKIYPELLAEIEAYRAGVPFIGACPGVDGLLIGAGHFRNGIAMAPATAELLTAKIL